MANDDPSVYRCLGKERFAGAHQAKKVVRNMKRFGKTVQAYACQHCNGWHVGRPKSIMPRGR